MGAFWSPSKQRAQSPPSTTSSPRCRPRPWTTPSAVDRPAQHGTCACRHGREGPARCLEADRRRAPDDGSRPTTPAWSSGRWRSTSKSEIPAVRELSNDLAGRNRRCDARPARDGALPARAPRRLRDHQGQRTSSKTSRRSTSATPWRNRRQGIMAASSAAAVPAVDLSGAEWDGYANLHGRRHDAHRTRARSSRPASAASK